MDYRRNSHPSCILEEIKEPELSGFIREFRLLVLIGSINTSKFRCCAWNAIEK